jgi:hypothetical protein
MEDKTSRVRWSDDELGRLATVMAPRLLADPDLHPLDAVRAAQACLEPGRRRELKAWSLVEGRLQPKLDEALARLRAPPSQPAAGGGPPQTDRPETAVAVSEETGGVSADALPSSDETDEGAQPQGGEGVAAELDAAAPSSWSLGLFDDQAAANASMSAPRLDEPSLARRAAAKAPPARTGKPSEQAPRAAATLDAAAIEAVLLAALQSPAVEEALVELFARTMAKALLRTGTGEARPLPAQPLKAPARRVLLAGFPEPTQKALMEALGESFDVRTWKPTNGPQLFQTLARLCRVVVFPEDADEEVDASLKDMDVRVIRHAGNAGRLIERLGELG